MAVMEAERVINLRALRNEAEWLPRTLDDAAQIQAALKAADVPNQVIYAMIGWLTSKALGQPDLTTEKTRSTYRKILADLKSPLESPASKLQSGAYLSSFAFEAA